MAACTTDVPKTDKPKEQQEPSKPNETSIENINTLILEDPLNIDLYNERAEFHISNGNLEAAIEDYDRALKIDSTHAPTLHEKGNTLFRTKDFDAAFGAYKTCLIHHPDDIACLLRAAEMNIHLRQYNKAIEHINNVLRQDDHQAMAYYMKGRIYKEQGDSSLAVSSYQTATEVDPQFYDAFMEAGLLYSEAGSDVSLEFFNSAIEINPRSVEALYAKAYHLQKTGVLDTIRWGQSQEVYEQIMQVDPRNAVAHFNYGFIDLEYRQNYNTAAKSFGEAINLLPGYYQAYYNRGLCRESMDQSNLALADYEKALEINPTYTAAAIAKSRVLNGQ